MSLINQMLKDLARRSKPLTDPDVILSGLTASKYVKPKTKKKNYWLLASIVVLLFILGLIQQFLLPKYYREQTLLGNFITEQAINIKRQSKPASELLFDRVALTGISMQVEKEVTSLRLFLSGHLTYRISKAADNKLILVLENTRVTANLPQIDTLNSALKVIKIVDQTDDSLKIILTLNQGAELSRLALNDKTELPELQIDLLYKNDSASDILQPGDMLEEKQISTIKKISYDTSIEDAYQRAIEFEKIGQDNTAITQLTKFLIEHPNYIAARKSLLSLLLKHRDLTKALQVVNEGLLHQPQYIPYIELKAQILVEKGDIKDALNLLQTTPPPIEVNPEYHAFIAALYQRQNKFNLAEKMYEQLLTIQPNNSIWWMGLGIAREGLNKNDSALLAYTKANGSGDLNPELKVYIENRIHALS